MLSRFLPYGTAAVGKRESSLTLLVYTRSGAGFPSWLGVPVTSLAAQNRLYSLNTPVSAGQVSCPDRFRVSAADRWFSPSPRDLPFSVSACGLSHIFLPLLASFRSACHAHRFRSRCSHAALCIHYEKASQHRGTAAPVYGSFYGTP